MDLFWHNPLANMYGPFFLVLYGTVAVGLLIFYGWLIRRADTTDTLPPLTVPPEVDPYEMAYLRGGENEAVRLVVFELMQRGYLHIVEEKTGIFSKEKVFARCENHPDVAELSTFARTAFDWFSVSRKPQDIFQSSPLTTLAVEYTDRFRQRIESESLLAPAEKKATAVSAGFFIALALLGLGLYKLVVALNTGHHNVLFLIGGMIVSLIAVVIVGSVAARHRLSKRGRAYLAALQERFDNVKQQAMTAPAGQFEPAWLAAFGLFGVTALAGTMYSDFGDMFHRSAGAGGCGGTGSSCGGGGCGGGGCGGGCGGCGGGD